MQKITPFLWFDGKAEEAMNFYTSIFKNSKIKSVTRYGEAGPGPKGTVMTGTFQLEGQDFMALNGGPHFTFSPAISFFVNCQTQQEVDELWEKLSEGGEKGRCGWLKDKYGLSWHVPPTCAPLPPWPPLSAWNGSDADTVYETRDRNAPRSAPPRPAACAACGCLAW